MEDALYQELRRLAQHYMRGERPGHLLQATALVNEAYLRLASLERMEWRDRPHFVAAAAAEMRRVLIDTARSRNRQKRGGGLQLTSIDGKDLPGRGPGVDVEALDDALGALEQFDAQLARIVELRYFGGLTLEETADALAISPATVGRGWITARAWLRHYLDTSHAAGE
ncbi:MAG TPA: ECF-type sigma factor [Vicinamibacterales bacterium]|nr:ECF-type sigma factor [Vicinamibacterales bacterium]